MIALLVYYIVPAILIVVLIGAVVFAVRSFRRYADSPYFRARSHALQTGWTTVLMAVIALGGIAASIYARQVIPPPSRSAEVPPTTAAIDAPTLAPLLADPTLDPQQPPTITPSAALPTPTQTAIITTVESSVTPPGPPAIEVETISNDISTALEPLGEANAFPVGTPRIYYWLNYDNMADGVSWSQVLYRDGELVRSESSIWEQGQAGSFYFSFDTPGGWPAGRYEVQFFVGDDLLATYRYDIVN